MYKMELIGNLTKDPEIRTVNGINGEARVTNFTVAANDGFGEHKQTLFVRMTAWNGFGEMCAKYLWKGSKVFAAGPVTVNAYMRFIRFLLFRGIMPAAFSHVD